jgi:hypothetical protein
MTHKTNVLASLASLAFVGLLVSASASAQITEGWGVQASAGSAGNCPSFCNGSFSNTPPVGGEFVTFATVADNTYGSSWATARFAAGANYLPELKTYATSALGKQASAVAFSSQGFSYTGSEPTRITLNINLTGSHSNNVGDGYASNSTGASIAVLRTNQLQWYPSFGTLVYEGGPPEEDRFVTNLFLSASEPGTPMGSLTFTIDPGQDFYVVAQLTSVAQNGVADASNTLVMNFSNATGLTAVSAVPEPHAALLLLAGLAGLRFAAKRRGS